MNIEIKEVPEKDLWQVEKLYAETLEPVCGWNFNIAMLNSRRKKHYVFGAFEGQKLVGALVINDHTFFEIGGLSVNKQYRRQGIGRSLVNRFFQKAKELQWDTVNVGSYNQFRATGFYKKMGFKVVGEDWDGYKRARDFQKELR
jgi:ribosomal protein S18 acetylase RimI-like enzyme